MKITKRQIRKIIRETRNPAFGPEVPLLPNGTVDRKNMTDEDLDHYEEGFEDGSVGEEPRDTMSLIPIADRPRVNQMYSAGYSDGIKQFKNSHSKSSESGGLSQLVPELTGGRRSSWQVRKEKELSRNRMGESKSKITKRQLRRIIEEEKARLMKEASPADMSMHDAADHYAKQNAKKAPDNLKLLATVIDNLTEMALGYDVDEESKSELLMQVELLQDVYSSMYDKTTGYRK